MNAFYAWANRHGVSAAALLDLRQTLGFEAHRAAAALDPRTEAHVSQAVRLEAADKGVVLWRNNVGALKDESGRVVRYGLANDTKQLNTAIKSGDLIGWRRVNIEYRHVGQTIAQFVSREVKAPGWKPTGSERDRAQMRWAELVVADGGDAKIVSDTGGF